MQRIAIVVVIVISLMSCGDEKNIEKTKANNPENTESSNVKSHNIKTSGFQSFSSIEAIIEEFKSCKSTAGKKHICKEFTAKAICKYYNISDFQNQGDYDESGLNEFIDYDDIFNKVEESSEWIKLGSASDQDVLGNAQENANSGIATIAIDVSKKNKTVVLIVKGKQIRSNSWGVNCPMSAALNPSKPSKSFVGKTLNYSFAKPENIVLYTKK